MNCHNELCCKSPMAFQHLLPAPAKKEILNILNLSLNSHISLKQACLMVQFAPDEVLVEVLPADICERKGEWEMYAIDRVRFQKRINDTEAILAPYLSKEHRSKISLMLQTDVEQKLCSISK
ncbi:unnamed protein product [Larinioides sclopetarius]|uniref:Protein DP71L n=1 Tax=Larinioides sclopetarius TaxID=280406 RepID=A0AAV1YY27_9ARAC